MNNTAVLTLSKRGNVQPTAATKAPSPSLSFQASAILDHLSLLGDDIEVLAGDARVSGLGGVLALVAHDAAQAARTYAADDNWLGHEDARICAKTGLSACAGLLRSIMVLGDAKTSELVWAPFEEAEQMWVELEVAGLH
ncbi:hypothetical protein [Caballeronia sp. LZ032]|uniref:hypothetical protein n=1 Tax=Caballeronia sp. LZ032 TaxID=3038565 RepID=UPI00285B7F84|nr:hypothetical protein [Caballeronia sp. LZ032]MDR5878806.1 hypothetical protein [Caballeronia sp. LZ032]